MTPCEKLGYKVGDRFVALEGNKFTGRSKGDILELVADDGTDCPWLKNVTTGEDLTVCHLHSVALVRTSDAPLKSGDEITQDGKKYRVTLEEIPQYEFKPGMMCVVDWDKADASCVCHTTDTRVVYIENNTIGREKIAYADTDGSITRGYVNTSSLRPE